MLLFIENFPFGLAVEISIVSLNMIVHLKKTDSKLKVVFDDNMKFRSYLSSYHNHVHNDVRHHCTCKCGDALFKR